MCVTRQYTKFNRCDSYLMLEKINATIHHLSTNFLSSIWCTKIHTKNTTRMCIIIPYFRIDGSDILICIIYKKTISSRFLHFIFPILIRIILFNIITSYSKCFRGFLEHFESNRLVYFSICNCQIISILYTRITSLRFRHSICKMKITKSLDKTSICTIMLTKNIVKRI